ncbi:MAG: hypothetical protein IBGAMO2_130017 [Arenicellales bacterium IbO2]|nr:MAG: hypothetical protein IBGAMO2_130017 [Arenicellales bacterium IbO2]
MSGLANGRLSHLVCCEGPMRGEFDFTDDR